MANYRCKQYYFVEVAGQEKGAFATKAKARVAKKDWIKFVGNPSIVRITVGPRLCEKK